jgi:hypothetical protein
MKKVFLVLTAAAVMVACSDKKKAAATDTKDTGTTTTTSTEKMDNSTSTTSTNGDVPTFSDPEVQKYVNDYTAFVNSYMEAYKSKDMTKVSQLATNMQEWSGRSMTIGQKLANNPTEAQKFSAYMTKLSQDWANAAKSMMPAQ